MASTLFRKLRFYLTRTLSPQDRAELTQLIESNGGEVSYTPAGATQLVDCEKLDARHPEWISTDFIKESVAYQRLQDSTKYSGVIFTTDQSSRGTKRRGRMKYTLEEDARMLHFAKPRGWESMDSVPESTWRQAEREKVTAHTAQSMHEHFRKQLQRKTLIEQRIIKAKAAATSRARLLEQEEEEEEVEMVEPPARQRASQCSTGFRDAATPESTTSTPARASKRTPESATRQEAVISESSTVDSRLREVQVEKFSGRERTRSRKPTSPLRISQRIRRSEDGSTFDENKSPGEALVSPPPARVSQPLNSTPTTPVTSATPATPATSEVPAVQSTPVVSARSAHRSTEGSQSSGKRQQKRKRSIPSSGAANSQEARSEVEDSDAESIGSKSGGANGIFFRSVWSDLIGDPSKRQMLQRFFEPPSTSVFTAQVNLAESVVSHPSEVEGATTTPVREGDTERREERQQPTPIQVEQATDEDTDTIIRQLQIDTERDVRAVVHALYYCSGDVKMAEAFLRDAAPSGMWCPDDDLLLVNLVAEEGTNRATVDAAVARGDFADMQVSRDTDAILKRVQFLR